MIARESIYLPLFNIVEQLLAPGAVDGPPDGKPNASGVSATAGTPTPGKPFNLVSREVIEVQRVPPGLQPVLFMDEALEEYVSDGQGLYHRRWTVYFHVGCTTTRGTASSTILNPLLDVLEAALQPGDGNVLGLGDTVTSGQFAGLSVKNLGNNSTDPNARQAVAYVPFQLNFGPY
jgi:hypothetical protein